MCCNHSKKNVTRSDGQMEQSRIWKKLREELGRKFEKQRRVEGCVGRSENSRRVVMPEKKKKNLKKVKLKYDNCEKQ